MEDKFEVVDRRTKDGEKTTDEAKKIVLAELDRNYDDPVPIFNYILVRQNAAETTWNGTRFLIPDSVVKAPNEGVVVATAECYIVDGKEFPMESKVKPGDLVKFSQYNNEPVKCDGEDFVLVSIFDVKFRRRVYYGVGRAV